jgi:hypothetical protein
VIVHPGAQPEEGEAFVIMNYASVEGDFANFTAETNNVSVPCALSTIRQATSYSITFSCNPGKQTFLIVTRLYWTLYHRSLATMLL